MNDECRNRERWTTWITTQDLINADVGYEASGLGREGQDNNFRGVLIACTECRNVENIAECDLSGSDLPLPHHCRRMTSDAMAF